MRSQEPERCGWRCCEQARGQRKPAIEVVGGCRQAGQQRIVEQRGLPGSLGPLLLKERKRLLHFEEAGRPVACNWLLRVPHPPPKPAMKGFQTADVCPPHKEQRVFNAKQADSSCSNDVGRGSETGGRRQASAPPGVGASTAEVWRARAAASLYTV